MPKKLIFLHIPKTGGTCITKLMKKEYGHVKVPTYQQTFQELYDSLKSSNNIPFNCFQGHMPFGFHEVLPGFEYATILRDPVKRVISNIKHIQRGILHPQYNSVGTKNINDVFLDESVIYSELNNFQTRLLSGDFDKCFYYKNGKTFFNNEIIIYDNDLMNKAKANLKKIKIIGFTEDFDTFFKKFIVYFQWNKIKSYNKANVANNRVEPSNECIKKIQYYNQMDQELYDFAKTL
jgi:Sulfotransferase family